MADDQSLSDEQVLELLKSAEQRLREAQKGQTQVANTTTLPSSHSLSLSTTEIPSYIKSTSHGAQVDPQHNVKLQERVLANGVRQVQDPVQVKAQNAKAKKADAGSDWYNLPRTNITPELKRDLQLLRMRSVLDPKRFYKKENSRPQVPEFSQVGTIIEGPTEFFSARLSNKERKRTFVEEVLAGESSTQKFKSKYNEIQSKKISGKKAHYKKLKEKRRGGK
ncbi:putative rRNA-processing protein fcf2 [Coleophoma crateriformis]|uniref:Putative rRNA-processing protein fcf2 n=1 Tax=Coleophoma crateriformis TaxID=565419 RepID=A0A3D8R833_9HELO|nr:putative rRNA-processing protein fcf2 [Coleophoma crateriformis]